MPSDNFSEYGPNEPTAETIIVRAQVRIAARRAAESASSNDKPWRWLLPVVVVSVLSAFLFAPGPLPQKFLLAMGGVCGLRPTHSYFAGGVQLPLEARMIGIFSGFSLTLLGLLAIGRAGARKRGNYVAWAVLTVFFGSMIFDGANSMLHEFGTLHLYTPNNTLRLITGLLSGIALAPTMLWLLSVLATPAVAAERTMLCGWELVAALVPVSLFGVLVMSESAFAYYPATLLGIGGIIAVLTMVILMMIVGNTRLRGRVTNWHQVVIPGTLALLVAFTVLAISAYWRWTTVGFIEY